MEWREIGSALFGGPKLPKIQGQGTLVVPKHVFEYPKQEIGQGIVAIVTGLVVLGLGTWEGEALWPPGRIIMGLGLSALGTWLARGIRRITIADGTVTAEFPGGHRRTWVAVGAYAEGRQVLVVVREKSSGRIAFVVRPGMPD